MDHLSHPILSKFLSPLVGSAASPKGSSGFVRNMPFPRAEAKKHSICHLLWKQDACCTARDVPMQQLSVFSLACTIHLTIPFTTALCPSPSFHLGRVFLVCFVFLCNASQLPWAFAFLIISTLTNANISQPAQLLSAQKGDMLLFSTDLITQVLFPRLKGNTCTNNVPTAAHSSWGDWAINACYWRWRTQSNLKMYDGQLIRV